MRSPLAIALLLVGCPPPERSGEITLGTGVVAFEPLAADGTAEIVAGIQGGWHVDAAVQTTFDPTGLYLTYSAVDAEQGDVLASGTYVGLNDLVADEVSPGLWEHAGDRVILDARSVDALIGRLITLQVEIDADEPTTDEADLRLVDDR